MTIPVDEWIALAPAEPPAAPRAQGKASNADDARLVRAIAVAERVPPSVEHHEGFAALSHAAYELASILGHDRPAIRAVLDVFNARCLPPWPAKRLDDAAAAAEGWVPPGAVEALEAIAAARAERGDGRPRFAPATQGGARGPGMGELGLGRRLSLLEPPPPLEYAVEGLCLAPSAGKISIIAGEPGGAKGPILDHLALCLASGAPAFASLPVTATRVALLDFEGARLTHRRLARMAEAYGLDLAALDDALHVYDSSVCEASPEYVAAIGEAITREGYGAVLLDSYTSAMLSTGIEANSPEFAAFARELGRLDTLVLAVAHANKAYGQRGGDPRLSDIAYSGALAAMAQTAIVVSYPTASRTAVRIACARAPEQPFDAFMVEFADTPLGGLAVVHAGAPPSPEAAAQAAARGAVREAADALAKQLAETQGSITRTTVSSFRGLRGKAIDQCIAILVSEGIVRPRTGPRGAEWHYVPASARPRGR